MDSFLPKYRHPAEMPALLNLYPALNHCGQWTLLRPFKCPDNDALDRVGRLVEEPKQSKSGRNSHTEVHEKIALLAPPGEAQ
jgi:hypothetical protein